MKKFLALLCAVLAVGISSAAFASGDPFKTHDGPFGIELKGFRLGMRFKSFDEITNFVFDSMEDKEDDDSLSCDVNIIQDSHSAGAFSFGRRKDKGITQVSYQGEYFTKNSGSMKEAAQMAKWSGDEFMAFVDKNPHLIIKIRGGGEFLFLKEGQNMFRLVQYAFYEDRFSGKQSFSSMLSTKDLAIILMNEYGVEDFIMLDPGASYGEAYFADEANGYCVLIGGVGVAGRGVVVFAVADRKTVYPISCDDVIYRYAEKDGKKGIFPNENGQDSPHGNLAKMGFSSVSDWIFEGLSGKACPLTMSNTIYYRDK